MNLELAGKTFIVTGGTDGLGLATATCLLDEGANVLITGHTEKKFAEVRQKLSQHTNAMALLAGDNADPDLPGQLKKLVLDRWGQLNGMLVSVDGPPSSKALTTGDELWRNAFESVFLGAIRLVRDLSVEMADHSAIALVIAPSSKVADPVITISNGLRPGLAMMVKSFASELGPRQIRINALWSGVMATERVKRLMADKSPDLSAVALKRLGDPMEFGRMATVLLSPVASFVTGAAIGIDGGTVKAL